MHNSTPRNCDSSTIVALRNAIHSGEWIAASATAAELATEPLPRSATALETRMNALAELLNAARASRTHLAATLTRVRAANRFRQPPADRQNLVEAIDY